MTLANALLQSQALAIAGEPLTPQSPLYVVRSQDEARASQTLLSPGGLVRIRGSHTMGKTSLMNHILATVAEAECLTVRLSLNQFNAEELESLDHFLQTFCLRVGDGLQLPEQLDEYWDDFFGSTICCKSYFEEYLLPNLSTPLVLALDDVDRLFSQQDLADDFFGLLRAWHEDAKTRNIWKQVRLVVAHSTDLYVPQNINKSPFNVGLPLELTLLSAVQVQDLAQQWQVSLSDGVATELMALTGGRPYLVQLALHELSQNGSSWGALLAATAASTVGSFAAHRQHLQQTLDQSPDLNSTLLQICHGQTLESLNAALVYQLDSLGIVRVEGAQASFSGGLYAQWFAQTKTL